MHPSKLHGHRLHLTACLSWVETVTARGILGPDFQPHEQGGQGSLLSHQQSSKHPALYACPLPDIGQMLGYAVHQQVSIFIKTKTLSFLIPRTGQVLKTEKGVIYSS